MIICKLNSIFILIQESCGKYCSLSIHNYRLEEAVSESKKADNVDLNILIGNCKNTYECIQMLLPIEEDALKLVSTMLNEASLPAGLWIIRDTFIYQLSAKNTNMGKISNFVANRMVSPGTHLVKNHQNPSPESVSPS